MTSYRLFPSTPGGLLSSYSGNILAGTVFAATVGGCWFEGFWWWCPSGGDTGAQVFALWASTAATAGTLVPGTTVTSGTLTADAWNYVPLATPIALGAGTQYVAATGWVAVHGFPLTANVFGAGGTYQGGIVNGPLTAYDDDTNPSPWATPQGLFGTASADPTAQIPYEGFENGCFWMDLQIRDTAPSGYTGSYRIWPNTYLPNVITTNDSAVNYVVATEVILSKSCTVSKIWYYSPSGTTQLATRASVYSVTGADSGAEVIAVTSPSWSGAAASGWVGCTVPGSPVLTAGTYKAAVYNSAGSPDGWSAKDAGTNYWATGAGASGFTAGPLAAPGLSAATLAYVFDGSAPGSTPPYTTGATEAGQCTFAMTGPQYPYLYVDGLAQNYWVDLEVTPMSSSDIGIPHPGQSADSPDDFAPGDPDSDVGEPNALGAQIGFQHPGLTADVPDDFAGTDPDSDVGEPGGVA